MKTATMPCLLLVTIALHAWAGAAATATQDLVVVENGRARKACFSDEAAWTQGDGYLQAGGNDLWLLANRGLGKGDFHITAKLSIHKLARSAARFSFNRGESSFGFEGSHGKIYITGIVCKGRGTAGALGPPQDAGIADGKPFVFEVLRAGKTLTFRVDGKTVHNVVADAGPVEVFGFEPRRAVMRIMDFRAQGVFLPDVHTTDLWKVWFHPQVTAINSIWHGPFVHLPNDCLLTIVNSDGGVRAFVSRDDGKTWDGAGRIAKQGQTFKIRDGNADTALLRTRKGTLVVVFLNIFDEKISWDYKLQEPKDDIKRFTWSARSLDNGQTWQDVQIVQRGYAGALRDIIQTSTGEIVVANQDAARNPGRHVSYTYVSSDEGKTWARSNGMDIGGQGDHAGSIEGTLIELRDSRLWILLRSYHGHFYECFSSDKGRSWTAPVASKVKASGSPGMLKRLASGRLVLAWNRFAKNRPRRYGRREELSIAFSEDDGKTWTEPVVVARERGKRQSYPQVFERRPGELWITTWQGRQFFRLMERDFVSASGR